MNVEERGGLAMREAAGEIMAEDARPADLFALAAKAAALAKVCAAEGRKIAPPSRPIACRAECGHCCPIGVAASPEEILRLARHVAPASPAPSARRFSRGCTRHRR